MKDAAENETTLDEEVSEDKMRTEDVSEEEASQAESSSETADTESVSEGTDGAAQPETDQETSKESRKEKKKKEKADKKQDALKEKITDLEDRVKRQMAEFDNFRKRTEKEKTAMFETGAKSVIEKILPVVDNFERGLAAIPEEEKGGAFAQGMEMIYKQLLTELESIDVKPIEALGKEFDPEFHNAVMQVESDEYESGVIAQELQKGYTYRDSVVRHSMVAVTT
ncbi:MAG: nucleotide exchange factor GrpE [Muribaculaceae bacterium]|nr:nucleotide exchange factor GrpE [Muribaculaceae bacterium]